ncbi:MAG TPA: DUF4153 domain-containing protein [Peptococcaceae bacterium]|nr:DUF4153 domain-containing protein [Peptococcaceae bacterium]
MKRWREMLNYLIKGMSKAIFRFPFTVICLAGATGLTWYMISLHTSPPLVIEKLMYTLLVGAFLGMAGQSKAERFAFLKNKRLAIYLVSLFLTLGYFLIIWPAPEVSSEIVVRTLVAVFAMLCAVLWVPSFKSQTDFNEVALIHFKATFTSVLYSGVLTVGIAAILAAIDALLFNVHSDAYQYTISFLWIMFAPLYYLSLLPKFNSEEEEDRQALQTAKNYPRFLDILVSYIAIPLVAVYTLVLLAYFIKILVTFHWPSGQLGPMVLIYSAAGLVIFVLASLLQNRFAGLYCKIFPKVLIPIVVMQLISVGIRLNAYGVTESRYYVALFGIFSILIGFILSIKPVTKNGLIALLAALFAVISIIPPVDAFTVSRVSQIARLENYLQAEGILVAGKLTPKADASEKTKIETTNILTYLDRSSSLKYIQWLPEDFNIYRDMELVLGFKPTYPQDIDWESKFFYAMIDREKPVFVSGYDLSVNVDWVNYRNGDEDGIKIYPFTLNGEEYKLTIKQLSGMETRIAVQDAVGTELIGTGIYEFAKKLAEDSTGAKEALPPEKMTIEVLEDRYRLKIVFQNINLTFGTDSDAGASYSAWVLFGVDEIR